MSRVKNPSVALLAGLAVGPALVAFGWPQAPGAIWERGSTAGGELVDRLGIVYFGRKVSDGSSWSVQSGGWIGTIAIAVGFFAHMLANKTGLNRTLARYRLGFSI